MFRDLRFGGVFAQVLGLSAFVMLFVAGCNTTKKTTPTPVLTITKTHTGSFTQGQQNATYAVTVTNTGTAATNGTVTVTEAVPSGLTLVSMAGTGWTCAAGGTTCARADALANGSSYPTITVTVNVTPSATSPQVNHVSVSGGGAGNASGQDSTTIMVPVLSVTKTHTGNFSQGQVGASYTVTVSNASGAAPTNGTAVTLSDTIPSGLSLVSMTGTGWTCVSNSCTRTDVLNGGASYPAITVLVNVAANAPTPQVNQVTVSGGGSATANASDSTTINEPALSIAKTHTGNFTQGQSNASYSVTVSNTGTLPTTGAVMVTDTMPSGETLVSMAGTGWTCPGTGGANTCDRSDALAAGSSYPIITVTVNVTSNASSPQVNQVSASGGGSATANGSDSTIIGSSDPCSIAGTGSESLLKGGYAFVLKGFDNGQGTGETTPEPALVGGVVTFNGSNNNGLITSGAIDMNLNSSVQPNLTVTAGTYKVGSDHRMCMAITTSAGTQHYRGSLGNISAGVASTGHLIDFDSAGPFTAGVLRKQSSTIPTSLSGNYAFGISSVQNTGTTNGHSGNGGSFGAVGVMDLASNGALTGGSVDFNQKGFLDGSSTVGGNWPSSPVAFTSGSYTIAADGRGALSFSPGGSATVHAVIYAVSSSEILLLGSDLQPPNTAFAGSALLQSGAPFSANPLSGAYVGYQSGLDSNTGPDRVTLLLINASGTSIAGNQIRNDGGSFQSKALAGINYSVASSGRMTVTGTSPTPIFYLVSANQAFILSGDPTVDTGLFESQSGGPFSNASASGTYAFGTVDPQDANVSDNVGEATFTSPNVSVTDDNNGNGSQNAGQTQNFTYAIDSTGLGLMPSNCTISSTSTTCSTILYVISPTKAVVMDVTSQNPTAQIADQ